MSDELASVLRDLLTTATANPRNTPLQGDKPDRDAMVVCGADQVLTR